jgi:hypothetical protein
MATDNYKAVYAQIGSQLDQTFFLFDNAISNPETVPLTEFEKMIDTDETVGTGLDFLNMVSVFRLGEYEHENTKITEFVRGNFEDMQGNLPLACQDILSALWAGYSGTEVVYKPAGKNVMLDMLATYHPLTVLMAVDKQTGTLEGIKQYRWYAGSPVDIPKEKCIVFSYGKRFGNHYGKSLLKRIRKNWLLKDSILKMWARGLDRFGTPLVAALVPDDEIDDPDNPGTKINQITWALRVLANLQSGTGLAFRSSRKDEAQIDVKTLTGTGAGVGEAFERAVLYFNKMIYRGLLVPSLVFDEGVNSGSYSLGQKHFDTFMMTVDTLCNHLSEVLLEQLVRRMIEYNFGAQSNYGNFQRKNLAEDDKKALSEVFLNMTNAGYLEPQQEQDFKYVRESLGMPEREPIPLDDKVREAVLKEYNRYPRGGENDEPPGEDDQEEA